MYKGKRIFSIIPARGGSKSIPRKNLKTLLGKPLIAWSIEQSCASHYIDLTIVSTEDPEIAQVSEKYGAKVILRPRKLSTDTTPTEPVLIDAIDRLSKEGVKPQYIVLLQPTSPIRRPCDIDQAIKMLIDESGDSLLSVRENRSFFWSRENKALNYDYLARPRRQDKQWEFVENGSIYITKREILLKEKNRLGGNILTYTMPDWASVEIDTPFDFEVVRFIAHRKLAVLKKNLHKIKLALFDVDGVFTDGSVYVDERGHELLRFSRIDGKGIEMLHKAGVTIAVITSEDTTIVKERMRKLNIRYVYTGVSNKEQVYDSIKNEFDLKDDEIAYSGDDIGDLNVIRKAGFAACPMNAVDPVKFECDYISNYKGGAGFVREICDLIIKSRDVGKYEENNDKE
jgi:YrbI family 3-deoxy-D-manno-octulosonate 8-phosphate phosphatase